MSAVVCKDVTQQFGNLTALDSVSLEVHTGEILGIIGPNGAGKTTLLNRIEGLAKPTSGSIEVLGLDPIADAHALSLRTGVQLQQAALPPWLKVGEALELFSSFYPHAQPWRPLLERLGITAKAGSYVDKLSGGERQRVFIALALLHEPELVFLDELTTALDPQARLAMWDVVRKIRDNGTTVVLTTHYMEEAESLCDRVGIIDHGRLIAMDTVPALIFAHGGPTTLQLELSQKAPESLSGLEGVTEVERGHSATGAPTATVRGTGAFAQSALEHLSSCGVTVSAMSTTAPSLEDVFLNLTGRSMREDH
ncbi:ABC-2 type transport system ATP-binding protein [Actinomyces ruminicola]|uniref:ABC-2 type transport system ATP-binding protein n=1 Tax=Actinomyces ruminicola TaxID=332524 RepID=A0A1H0DPJ3_9ACTO|nr:ABC transporter ATP-binding protein [Actinomyces ruminicola]SDN72074.1 ABC-2 type transport system ATP-binding protein [Actinomyces ruminicola]